MKNNFLSTIKVFFEVMGIVLIVLILIGLFNTNFTDGNAILLTNSVIKEKEYVENVHPMILEFNEQLQTLEETNELSDKGKIVPLKVSQIYANTFDEMQNNYDEMSYMEVPERFQQFHTSFLKCMEIKGATINEIITYLTDRDSAHLVTVDSYNNSFKERYSDAIITYNRLLDERNN